MSEIKDIPAFPSKREGCNNEPDFVFTTGMTLRDYFAGQVISSLIDGVRLVADFKVAAEQAYIIADELLKARG